MRFGRLGTNRRPEFRLPGTITLRNSGPELTGLGIKVGKHVPRASDSAEPFRHGEADSGAR